MTESEETSLPRACDGCRNRKVRCDKQSPCHNCRAANITCKTTTRQCDITKPRARVLISNQYEQKIDRLESRLENIERLLETLASNSLPSVTPRSQGISPASRSEVHVNNSTPASTANVDHFEGESSLAAHSNQAHEALQSLLNSSAPGIRNDLKTVQALASLQGVLQRHQKEANSSKSMLGEGEHTSLQNRQFSELPPQAEITRLMQYIAADDMSAIFTWWLFPDVEVFYKLYDEFCRSPSTCPLSGSIIVYCTMCWVLNDNPILAKANVDTLHLSKYVVVCQRHLEICIRSYHMFTDPTVENIAALFASASYMIYQANISMAWTLTCTAARLCQSLGWHRSLNHRDSNSKEMSTRTTLFWSIYYLDKCLSLRLGQSSTLQDYDISATIDGVWLDYVGSYPAEWSTYAVLSIEMAKVQGLVYEKLYSPGSVKSPYERQNTGQELANKINHLIVKHNECFKGQTDGQDYKTYFIDCNEVVLPCLLTLVHRAMPSSPQAHQLCLQSARASMQAHYRCNKRIDTMGQGLRIDYMSWSILLCPFTPFIVLFRNVVTDLNFDDLKLLEHFVNSIEWLRDNQKEPLQRFQQLCEAFYNLAKHFVAARIREDTTLQSTQGMTMEGNGQFVDIPEVSGFDGQLDDMMLPGEFQDWLNNNMDLSSNDWLAFGTL